MIGKYRVESDSMKPVSYTHLLYYKKKMFEGELFLIYIALYGIGRTWIEAVSYTHLDVYKRQRI